MTVGALQAVKKSARPVHAAALIAAAMAIVTLPGVPFSGETAEAEADQAVAAVPADGLWLAPATEVPTARQPLAQAVEALNEDQAERAMPVFAKSTSDPLIGGYAMLYLGRAQLALNRTQEGASTAKQLLATHPSGHLADAALWLAADAAELQGDWPEVVKTLQTLAANQPADPQRVQLRLGRAALKVDDRRVANAALNKVYYEYPLTVEAIEARQELDKVAAPKVPEPPTPERIQLDFGRAERLYSAARYTDARKAFDLVRPIVAGDERQMADLRLAQCDYHLKRYQAAHDALRAYVDRSRNRLQEAQFFLLNSIRQLGRKDEYQALVRAFVDGNPGHQFAEAALNELGTFWILENEDAQSRRGLRRDVPAVPEGPLRRARGVESRLVGLQERRVRRDRSASSNRPPLSFPRADYRPTWLYWTARSRQALKDREAAEAGFRQVIADYRNSYYGRQATAEIERMLAPTRPAGAGAVAPARRTLPSTIVVTPPPPNAKLITRAAVRRDCTTTRSSRCERSSACPARRRCSTRRSPTRSTARAICVQRSPRCAAPIRNSWRTAGKRCRRQSSK